MGPDLLVLIGQAAAHLAALWEDPTPEKLKALATDLEAMENRVRDGMALDE